MPKPTKIEKVETFLWDRWLLIKIHCEDGTVGIGEGGVHGWQRPTKTMVETMEPYLLGQDPTRSSTTTSGCTAAHTSWVPWCRARCPPLTSRFGTSRASDSTCQSTT